MGELFVLNVCLCFISSSTSLTPIRVYSLGIIVQTSEYFINKRLSKYLLSIILMPCVPKAQGIALMGSTLENAGVELCCTITGARQNSS